MRCEGCRGSERPGWRRLPPTYLPVYIKAILAEIDRLIALAKLIEAEQRKLDRPVWVPCEDCIGGIASCCDGAGSNQAAQQRGRS